MQGYSQTVYKRTSALLRFGFSIELCRQVTSGRLPQSISVTYDCENNRSLVKEWAGEEGDGCMLSTFVHLFSLALFRLTISLCVACCGYL